MALSEALSTTRHLAPDKGGAAIISSHQVMPQAALATRG